MGILLLLQVFLIALNAVFACAEIAVLSVNENKINKLAEQGSRKARRLGRLIRQPEKFLATIQVAITLSGFLGSAFAADNFSDGLVEWLINIGVKLPRGTLDTIAVILITLILSYFTLILGELVPKRLAMKKAEQLALGVSGLISGISYIFRPIVWLLSVSTNAVLRLLGVDPTQEDEEVSEEEILLMVDASSEKGAIDHEEKELIQNVFDFDDVSAGEIVTHRTDVDILWMEDDEAAWAATIHNTRHNLYPVCGDSPDNVVGILNAKDYFRVEDKSRDNIIREAISPAYFVPETIKADVLFRNMKKSRNTLAVVLDEYGGMVGIVTLNDLVEELVGELISDEDEEDTPAIQRRDENTWIIRDNPELQDIEEATGIHFDTEEYDTLTGFVFDALGMVPNDGHQDLSLDYPEFTIKIKSIQDHQLAESLIRLKKMEEPESKEE